MAVLGIIFSNIHDKEIFEVSRERTIASTPIGGRYRLIDFALSNMVNSDITTIGIVIKSNYQSLMDHVGSGKEWDLARKRGGLTILPPYGADPNAIYNTRLQALKSILRFIKEKNEEFVILTDCYNVCNIDYKDIINFHVEHDADITCVYREHNISLDDYMPIATLNIDKNHQVRKFDVRRNYIGPALVSTETWIMRRELLVSLVEDAVNNQYRSFNRDILSRNIDKLKVFGYEFTGFYRSIGSIESYYDLNMDLLDSAVRDELFNKPGHAIYTKVRDSAPTKYTKGSAVHNSLIADNCTIKGTVINSILFRGVVVEEGAVVKNCILMQGTNVSKDTSLEYVITDKNVKIIKEKELLGLKGNLVYIRKNEVI